MLVRGATRRCGVCGIGNLFTGWFRMRERCPRCGYVFAREDGFSLGAILMNFAVTELLLAVFGIVPLIAVLAANPDANIAPVVLGGVLAVVAGPFLFYRSPGRSGSRSSSCSVPLRPTSLTTAAEPPARPPWSAASHLVLIRATALQQPALEALRV
jgi:uncharacterized protein (DUF983 family)